MKLEEIRQILNAVVLTNNDFKDISVARAYGADLMSDVLAFSITNSLLITSLTNTQVIRTAEVADVKAIVFVQSKRPDIKTIELAEEKKIPLFVTGCSMFDACGRLYEKGLRCQTDTDF
ncbi:MAG: hypothetical protein Q8K51_15465 [Nitrospirota bacterium]|nr:hypothetical protein [Nitrospirota bacterium]